MSGNFPTGGEASSPHQSFGHFSIRSRPRIGIERGPFGCVTDDLDHRPCAAIDKTISCHLIAERAGDRCRFETSGASPINAGSLLRSVIGYASEFLSRFLPSFRSSIVRNRSEKWSAGRKEKSFEGRKGSARPISLFPRNANPSFPPGEPLVSALFHEISPKSRDKRVDPLAILERKKKKKKQTNFLTIPFFSSCCRRRGQRQKQLLSLDRERTAGNHL